MNTRGRGRNGRRGRGPSKALAAVERDRRARKGHTNVLRGDPPPFTLRPWYPMVVGTVIASAGVETFYTPLDIVNLLSEQFGLGNQSKAIANIRLQRVDVWATATATTADRPSVSLDVSSLVPSTGDPTTGAAPVFYSILKKTQDQGTLSESATVSYTWPDWMSELPLSSNTAFTAVGIAGNTANINVRFHLLWTLTDIAAPQP
jgi:hypothetical protein